MGLVDETDESRLRAVREYFDRDAETYRAARYLGRGADEVAYVARHRLALEMIGHGPGRLLDAGGGPGIMTEALQSRGFSVWSVDLSWEMLRRTRDRLPGPTAARRQLAQADVTRLPFGPASFDRLACIGVLGYLRDPAAGLRELARVLRPGGTAVVQASLPGGPARLVHEPLRRARRRLLGTGPRAYPALPFELRRCGLRELHRYLAAAGLEVVDRAFYDFRPPLLEWISRAAAGHVARALQPSLERRPGAAWLAGGVVVRAIRG